MTPMLGIMASAISGNLWAPGKDFDSIATVTVGSGGSSTISFTSIPSTYRHLQIRFLAQTNRGTYPIDRLLLNINSDSGSNYSAHMLRSDPISPSSSALATSAVSQTTLSILELATSVPGASFFGGGVIDILDYANTNKYKTLRSLGGSDSNGATVNYAGYVEFGSGLWINSSAVTSIVLDQESGTLFNQYSSFALYGVK